MKKNKLIISTTVVVSLIGSFKANALVDYSESSGDRATSPVAKVNRIEKASNDVTRKNPMGGASFDFRTSYQSIAVASEVGEGQVGLLSFDGHFEPGHDLFLDLNYWMAQANETYFNTLNDGTELSDGQERGNATIKLGLKWLKFFSF